MTMNNDNAARTGQDAPAPRILWSPCPDTNRAFLCVEGVDNNIAEVFAVEHPDYLCAHDTACRIARIVGSYDSNQRTIAALTEALEDFDAAFSDLLSRRNISVRSDEVLVVEAFRKARAVLAQVKNEAQP